MKKIIGLVFIICFLSSPLFAQSRLGLGIDFFKGKREVSKHFETYEIYDYGDDYSFGIRLIYENLIKRSIGLQFELGYEFYETEYDFSNHDDEVYEVDLTGILKYHYYLKSEASIFIGGGISLDFQNVDYINDKRERWSLLELATIGFHLPVTNRFSLSIEDRFTNEISDGKIQVGFVINL